MPEYASSMLTRLLLSRIWWFNCRHDSAFGHVDEVVSGGNGSEIVTYMADGSYLGVRIHILYSVFTIVTFIIILLLLFYNYYILLYIFL